MNWLIIGLGNPGEKYAHTRHNVGRLVLQELADRHFSSFSINKRTNADIATIPQGVLAQPRSFMNLSGGPSKAVADYFKISADHIVVIHDELELDPGVVKLRQGGGDKGHNGLKSITKSLGTKDYWRLSCGIGRPPGRMDPASYVLKPFPRGADLAIQCADAADEIESLLS